MMNSMFLMMNDNSLDALLYDLQIKASKRKSNLYDNRQILDVFKMDILFGPSHEMSKNYISLAGYMSFKQHVFAIHPDILSLNVLDYVNQK